MGGKPRHKPAQDSAHSTNYFDTFIAVAPDCAAATGTSPPGDKPTVASLTFRMIHDAPYRHTSDDVLFAVWADRHDVPPAKRAAARAHFFSKGQPCLRASPLAKTYGWGFHHDRDGKVAMYPVESPAYASLAEGRGPDGEELATTAAMRSRR